jgi:hypothetical protein
VASVSISSDTPADRVRLEAEDRAELAQIASDHGRHLTQEYRVAVKFYLRHMRKISQHDEHREIRP